MPVDICKFELSVEENNKIERLRKLVINCKSLKIGTEIEILGRYLHCNSWEIDKAYQQIHDYYDFKNKYPDWVTSAQKPDDFNEIIDLNTRILLPHTDKQGKFIVVQKSIDAFDRIPNYAIKLIQLDDLIYEAILSSPRGQKYGLTTIIDTAGIKLVVEWLLHDEILTLYGIVPSLYSLFLGINKNYLKFVTPSIATVIGKKCDIMPIRLEDKKAHFIIRGFIVNAVMSMILPFLGSLKKLAVFHKNPDSEKLKEYVGQEYLPHEYGGPEENIFDSSYLKEFLKSRYSYIEKFQKYYKEQ